MLVFEQDMDLKMKHETCPPRSGKSDSLKAAIAIAMLLGLAAPAAARTDNYRMEHGKYLAAMCTTCHQPDRSYEGIPTIFGYSPREMTQMMLEYKDSIERHEVMENIAKSLSIEEISALSLYLASLGPKKNSKKAAKTASESE